MKKHVAACGAASLVVGVGLTIATPASADNRATEVVSSSVGELALSPVSQQSAVRAANNYLSVMPFSRTGLIRQLVEFDGYSAADATFAVDSITVDWNEQAARAAQNYLEVMPFSYDGLVNQLTSFDGYTYAQASYGVSTTGL